MTWKPKKKKSAGARIKSQGKSLVWVTFGAAEKQKIRMSAAAQGIPMSQFLHNCGLTAAEKILKNLPEITD